MITRLLGELGGDLVAEESCAFCACLLLEPEKARGAEEGPGRACDAACSAPPHHVLTAVRQLLPQPCICIFYL